MNNIQKIVLILFGLFYTIIGFVDTDVKCLLSGLLLLTWVGVDNKFWR